MAFVNPKVTCGAIIEKEGKILLTKRNIPPYKGYWCIPGGHIDWGEKVEEAMVREIKEEVNLDFKPKFFKYYDEIIPEINWHAVVFIFTGSFSGQIKIEEKEIEEFKWFSEPEIKSMKLAFIHKEVIEDYFKYV